VNPSVDCQIDAQENPMALDKDALAELASAVRAGGDLDVIRSGMQLGLQALIELEASKHIGADRYERTGERVTHRNGHRERLLSTKAGDIELRIPKLREGSLFPSLLEPGRRIDRALWAVVMEAYAHGVSTRKIERLATQLGIEGTSKSTVSRTCSGLDERASAFRNRPLEGAYPCIWLDARIERVRDTDAHTVRHKALPVAYGVHESGRREVIGIEVGGVESEASWREFIRDLVARGLAGVQLVISDAHPGLRKAIQTVIGARWQRCCVHFVRDMLGHVPRQSHPLVRGALKQVFAAIDRDMATQVAAGVIAQLTTVAPRWRTCSKTPRRISWPRCAFPVSTGRRSAAHTPWRGSTARSRAARTWLASTPTMTP